MINQDSLDILLVMLHNDDQGVIITRFDSDGILIENSDINPCFPSCSLR